MKLLKKLACATALTAAMIGSASAETVLNNWVFNPVGTGYASGQTVNEYLDINGTAFLQLTPTSASTFSFTEMGTFNSTQADSNAQLFPVNYAGGNITATFAASGTGTFGGSFIFTGGTINIYQNPTNGQYATTAGTYGANLGNLIASFNITVGGGGNVDATGNPTGNGQVNVFAQATKVAAGYFFNADGTDLSTTDLLAFAFTDANTIGQPTNTAVQEIACQFAGYTGAGCNGSAYKNSNSAFFVSNNGQFKLAEVPEPGSLALFGIAMLGAGVVSRKRNSKV